MLTNGCHTSCISICFRISIRTSVRPCLEVAGEINKAGSCFAKLPLWAQFSKSNGEQVIKEAKSIGGRDIAGTLLFNRTKPNQIEQYCDVCSLAVGRLQRWANDGFGKWKWRPYYWFRFMAPAWSLASFTWLPFFYSLLFSPRPARLSVAYPGRIYASSRLTLKRTEESGRE